MSSQPPSTIFAARIDRGGLWVAPIFLGRKFLTLPRQYLPDIGFDFSLPISPVGFKFLSLIAVFYVAYALLCVSSGKENRVGTFNNFLEVHS